ncbi:MAG: hypothetical protein R2769_05335 [Saprospiraceae bacterium]
MGIQRWLKFSKYLPQFGWKPIIYTPENPDFGIQDQTLLSDISKEAEVIKRPIWEPYSIYRIVYRQQGQKCQFWWFTAKVAATYSGSWQPGFEETFFIPDQEYFGKILP